MDTKAKSQFRLLFPCYFSFFVNGAMVLLVGAILPYIIEEAGINWAREASSSGVSIGSRAISAR